jgi:hypothetical protein
MPRQIWQFGNALWKLIRSPAAQAVMGAAAKGLELFPKMSP